MPTAEIYSVTGTQLAPEVIVESVGKAAVLEHFNEPLVVQEFPVPAPTQGALLVKIELATVCGSDLHVWANHLGSTYSLPLPLVLGHEMVGEIVAIGEGADVDSLGEPLKLGDRVIWSNEGCGRCYECTVLHEQRLCTNRKLVGLTGSSSAPHFTGAFAEYGYITPGQGRVRVPDAVESGWASAASCALRTVINTVEAAGRIDYLDSVVVQGSGPLGLFATALVSTLGPQNLIVIGAPADRLKLAEEWGASATVSIEDFASTEERRERVLQLTGGRGASVVLELSGGRGAVAEAIDMLQPAGRLIISGTVGGDRQSIDASRITTRGLRVQGSMSGDIDSYYKALRFLEQHQGRFDWNRMLGKEYGLDEVTDALHAMQRMEEIKPVIVPGSVK